MENLPMCVENQFWNLWLSIEVFRGEVEEQTPQMLVLTRRHFVDQGQDLPS